MASAASTGDSKATSGAPSLRPSGDIEIPCSSGLRLSLVVTGGVHEGIDVLGVVSKSKSSKRGTGTGGHDGRGGSRGGGVGRVMGEVVRGGCAAGSALFDCAGRPEEQAVADYVPPALRGGDLVPGLWASADAVAGLCALKVHSPAVGCVESGLFLIMDTDDDVVGGVTAKQMLLHVQSALEQAGWVACDDDAAVVMRGGGRRCQVMHAPSGWTSASQAARQRGAWLLEDDPDAATYALPLPPTVTAQTMMGVAISGSHMSVTVGLEDGGETDVLQEGCVAWQDQPFRLIHVPAHLLGATLVRMRSNLPRGFEPILMVKGADTSTRVSLFYEEGSRGGGYDHAFGFDQLGMASWKHLSDTTMRYNDGSSLDAKPRGGKLCIWETPMGGVPPIQEGRTLADPLPTVPAPLVPPSGAGGAGGDGFGEAGPVAGDAVLSGGNPFWRPGQDSIEGPMSVLPLPPTVTEKTVMTLVVTGTHTGVSVMSGIGRYEYVQLKENAVAWHDRDYQLRGVPELLWGGTHIRGMHKDYAKGYEPVILITNADETTKVHLLCEDGPRSGDYMHAFEFEQYGMASWKKQAHDGLKWSRPGGDEQKSMTLWTTPVSVVAPAALDVVALTETVARDRADSVEEVIVALEHDVPIVGTGGNPFWRPGQDVVDGPASVLPLPPTVTHKTVMSLVITGTHTGVSIMSGVGRYEYVQLQENGIAWHDREYRLRGVPASLIGGTHIRGMHKEYAKGYEPVVIINNADETTKVHLLCEDSVRSGGYEPAFRFEQHGMASWTKDDHAKVTWTGNGDTRAMTLWSTPVSVVAPPVLDAAVSRADETREAAGSDVIEGGGVGGGASGIGGNPHWRPGRDHIDGPMSLLPLPPTVTDQTVMALVVTGTHTGVSVMSGIGVYEYVQLQEGGIAWHDRDYVLRGLPDFLLGGTHIRGMHKDYAKGYEPVVVITNADSSTQVHLLSEDGPRSGDFLHAFEFDQHGMAEWTKHDECHVAWSDAPLVASGAGEEGHGRRMSLWSSPVKVSAPAQLGVPDSASAVLPQRSGDAAEQRGSFEDEPVDDGSAAGEASLPPAATAARSPNLPPSEVEVEDRSVLEEKHGERDGELPREAGTATGAAPSAMDRLVIALRNATSSAALLAAMRSLKQTVSDESVSIDVGTLKAQLLAAARHVHSSVSAGVWSKDVAREFGSLLTTLHNR